ncbi:hypothetical protein [Treponema bryantii]|uniref:hypothetical protein n=1 Tax=Treponema bryantii TaxID=163 RepID=UPI0018C9D2BC|nr:hypothetical protein [Treponema bryantii]
MSFSKVRFFTLISVCLAFISCGNLFENQLSSEDTKKFAAENPLTTPAATSENQNFVLTGSMVIDGAMPDFNFNNDAADSRSALPEFAAGTVEYFVYATDGDGNTVDGSFGEGSNSKTFSIPLVFGKTWTITCGMRNKNGSQEEFLTASSTPKTYTSSNYTDPLVLYPVPATTGKGELELSMSIPSSIQGIDISCISSNSADWAYISTEITPGSGDINGSVLIRTGASEVFKLNSGVYKIRLNFYKDSAKTDLIFQTFQSINVFYGLKTTKWKDAAASSSASPILSDGTFVLTENNIKQFLATNFYVGPSGATGAATPADTNDGSHNAPFATLERALTQIENYGLPENDYKIHISDLVFPDAAATAGYTISSSFDNKMNSLTLMGLTAVNADGISGNDRFRALTISTSKKVTIKNLTISDGKAEDGAGLYYNGTGKLIIDNCIIKDNEATRNGGAIYSSGNVQIISTNITINVISGDTAGTGEGLYIFSGSVTMTGGGISQNISQLADSGAIFVRKGAEFNFNDGLISDNGSRAIYNNGTVNMTEGTISGHTAIRGGAIYNNGSLNINGGSITGNSAIKNPEGDGGNGGAIYVNGADTSVTPNVIPSLEITGGTITGNTAECFGGGIYNASKLTVSGGEISGNYITGTENCGGGAIASFKDFTLGKDAYIPAGTDEKNDIYLYDSGDGVTKFHIKLSSPLVYHDSTDKIKLTPAAYTNNRPMIALATGSTADLSVEYEKFTTGPDEAGHNYLISNTGLLKAAIIGNKAPSEAKAVGDIIFNDGSAMAYSDFAALDDDGKAALKTSAIALIFYKGTECSNDNVTERTLGVGLIQSENLVWCVETANAHDENIDTIQCQPEQTEYPYTFDIFETSLDKNGSDNLLQIANKLEEISYDDTGLVGTLVTVRQGLENYPLISALNTYSAVRLPGESTSRIPDSSPFKTGWYLPSFAELIQIREAADIFAMNTAIESLGGMKFGNYAYWSSSQCSDAASCALAMTFNQKRLMKLSKETANHACIIREF